MRVSDEFPEMVRVFIVEDSPIERFRLSEMLKQAGFAVIGAVESAEEAHEQVIAGSNTEPPFDLMLVDLRLPAMDGVDFCRIVKADPRYQFIPLIIVTADESTAQLQRAFDAGVVDFVRKPVNRVELSARIKAATKSWWMEKQLRHMAHYDSLTGLVNRPLLMDRLEQAIRSAARCKSTVELIFVDLDRFKSLNDTLGHKAGDLALQETAQRLRGLVRESDTVARLGGDEFVILLSGSPHNDQGSSRLNEMINDAFGEPFNLNGESWQLGVSIGVARYPDMGTTAQELLLIADRSMYVQKRCHHKQVTRSADAG